MGHTAKQQIILNFAIEAVREGFWSQLEGIRQAEKVLNKRDR